LFLALLLCSAGSCRAPSGYRADADKEVYQILDEVRARLSDDVFRIDPPVNDLRSRILAGEEAAEDALPPLSLVQVLEIAAENSREFQSQREALFLAALDLTRERWEFSVKDVGVLGAFLSDPGAADSTAGGDGALTLTRLFETGARVMGSIGFDLARDISSADGWSAFTNLSLNITQPILRGFGRDIVREPLTQSERDVLYQARTFERFRRTFAFDATSRYFRVLEQMDTVKNEELNLENLGQLRERNEAFAEAGLLSDIQVDQARQDELRSKDNLVAARRQLEERLDGLKLFLGLPIETKIELDQAELETLERFDSPEISALSEDEAADLALRERLDHAVIMDRIDDSERRVKVFADALRTGLDLSADVGARSDANQPFAFGSDGLTWDARLDLDLPIDRLPERNAYRAGLIARDAAVRDGEASSDGVRADVRDARRTLDAARQSHSIQSGAVVLAERRVESAALNLEAGRASTRDLLEGQEALVQAQNAATRAQIDQLLAELALYRDLELLRVGPDGLSVDISRIGAESPSGEENP